MLALAAAMAALSAAASRPADSANGFPLVLEKQPVSASAQHVASRVSSPTRPVLWVKRNVDDPSSPARLPRGAVPRRYRMRLVVGDLRSAGARFSGVEEIDVITRAPIDALRLHAASMSIEAVGITGDEGGLSVASIHYFPRTEQILLRLDRRVPAHQRITLHFNFSARLGSPETMRGLYRSSYVSPTRGRRWIAATQLEPTSARRVFPCFDEPEYKSIFSISVEHDKGLTALSNMPMESRSAVRAGGRSRTLTRFFDTPKMSAYLVAIVLSDFSNATFQEVVPHTRADNAKGQVIKPKVSVWAPSHLIQQGNFALRAAVAILDRFSTVFGTPYTLPKLDLVAVPDFAAGAMENWGIATFRMSALLVDESDGAPAPARERVLGVVAHELAHMWFGDLVTTRWWGDLFLNEGFASFFEFEGANAAAPMDHIWDHFQESSLYPALTADAVNATRALAGTVRNDREARAAFDAISYDKGASVLRMFRAVLGPAVFESAVRLYLARHAYSSATARDLETALTRAAATSIIGGGDRGLPLSVSFVAEFVHRWMHHAGFPLLTVRIDPVKKSEWLVITQERFVATGRPRRGASSPSSRHVKYTGPLWPVPLSLSSTKGWRSDSQWLTFRRKRVHFRHKSDTMNDTMGAVDLPWIKANTGQRGFFRVRYGPVLWSRFRRALMRSPDAMPAVDRAGLVADAFAVARAGYASVGTFVSLLAFLQQDTDPRPWAQAHAGLAQLLTLAREGSEKSTSGSKGAGRRVLCRFVSWLVSPGLRRAARSIQKELRVDHARGSERIPAAVPPQTAYRQILLSMALSCDIPAAARALSPRFAAWLNSSSSSSSSSGIDAAQHLLGAVPRLLPAVSADYRRLVLTAGVRASGAAAWTKLLAVRRRMLSQGCDPEDIQAVLGALADTRSQKLLSRLLDMSLDPSQVRPQDSVRVVCSVARNPSEGGELAWGLLRRSWRTLAQRYAESSFSLERLVGCIVPAYVGGDGSRLLEVRRFFAAKEEMAHAGISRVIARTAADVAFWTVSRGSVFQAVAASLANA